MTAYRLHELLLDPSKIREDEKEEYVRLLGWKKRSDAAKRAVQTKRARYKLWPCNRRQKDMKKGTYDGQLLDITGAEQVEVKLKADHKVLWVNIEGVCRLRVCNIQNFKFEDERYPGE